MNYSKDSHLVRLIKQTLREDVGSGDITTEFTIPVKVKVRAAIVANESGIVCGIDITRLVFKLFDNKIEFTALASDGDRIYKGETLVKLYGLARSILTCERVALNFLSLLSGIASGTRQFIDKAKPYSAKIMDTRKTIPGLRSLEKYAVRVGGGCNHRMGLYDAILIKDNHLAIINPRMKLSQWEQISPPQRLAGPPRILAENIKNLKNIINDTKEKNIKKLKIEIEVKNLQEFKEALNAKPDIIMLDNMRFEDIKKAVRIRNGLLAKTNSRKKISRTPRPKLEVSGGITLKNIRKIAACGVEMISIGALTDSINSLDISLEVK